MVETISLQRAVIETADKMAEGDGRLHERTENIRLSPYFVRI
jgi:hypothetical protein